MSSMLYVTASGARQLMNAQAVYANNLANANTTGFQADLAQFRAQPVFGPGYGSRAYAVVEAPGLVFDKGAIQTTGRPLDVAVDGDGWIAVQAADGSEAYTRAGNLRISPAGLLVTASGLPVMGDGGPISIPEAQKIEIGADGSISVLPKGQAPTTMAVVGRIKLVAPPHDRLVKGADGLLRMKDGRPAPADARVRLIGGALEGSNVNAVENLIGLIEAARRFEAQVKLMQVAKQNDAAAARLMQLG